MIEVHKDRHPNLPYTYYKIVGDNGEPDSTGTYYVTSSRATSRSGTTAGSRSLASSPTPSCRPSWLRSWRI